MNCNGCSISIILMRILSLVQLMHTEILPLAGIISVHSFFLLVLSLQNASDTMHLLSPPNEVSEGTMKRAPYVCVCVRACVNEKCYFSSISWPILILFVLSDRAGWGLQNQRKMLLLCHFLADFDSVCFI